MAFEWETLCKLKLFQVSTVIGCHYRKREMNELLSRKIELYCLSTNIFFSLPLFCFLLRHYIHRRGAVVSTMPSKWYLNWMLGSLPITLIIQDWWHSHTVAIVCVAMSSWKCDGVGNGVKRKRWKVGREREKCSWSRYDRIKEDWAAASFVDMLFSMKKKIWKKICSGP